MAVRLLHRLVAGFGLALVACAQAAPDQSHDAALTAEDFSAALIALAMPPSAEFGDIESLVSVPTGYAALYRKTIGQGKSQSGFEHRVFLSSDGVHWSQHDVPTPPAGDYRALAYGAGRYLIAGQTGVSAGALASSSDGDTWQVLQTDLPAILHIAFLNGRFFALALLGGIYTSDDGLRFTGAVTNAVQLGAIAYGSGTYVVVGSGPFEISSDGNDWQVVSIDCGLPGACVTPPGGTPIQGFHANVLFANGAFYSDKLVSNDARTWRQTTDDQRVPDAFNGGWLMRLYPNAIEAWHDAAAPLLRAALVTDNPKGLDCTTHRCMIVAKQLVLIP
jgi:hypothetical protein